MADAMIAAIDLTHGLGLVTGINRIPIFVDLLIRLIYCKLFITLIIYESERLWMSEEVLLGSAPSDEDHAQIDETDYRNRAMRECRAYIKAIRRKIGLEPDGARLHMKAFELPFGTHYETVCTYDSTNSAASDYALKCEAECPSTWSEAGMKAPGVGLGRGSR
jgi:hypothetical protein